MAGEAMRYAPDALATVLSVTLPDPAGPTAGNGRQHVVNGAAVASVQPVDLANYPLVQAALDKNTGDRSDDTYRVTAVCKDSGLNVAQTRWAVRTRTDLASRLDGRRDDDVQVCWDKIDARVDDVTAATESVTHSAHLGMAIKMGKQFKGKLIYINKISWHVWDGTRYAPDGSGAARRAVHSVIKRDRKIIKSLELPCEEEEKRLKQIARYETASAITGILTEAAALEVFSVEVSDLDADPYLFNCANGTLDLRTMKLQPHNPADRITKVADAAYDPDAISTDWPKFLQKVLPDDDVSGYLQRTNGVSLLGEVNGDKQILPILIGGGANGKTTYIEAVTFALGDYAMTAEPTLLMEKRGDAHPTGIADLVGRRFVSVCETEQRRRFDITTLKWLTGGDTLKARLMRKDFFSFQPSHMLVLATNHLPRIDDDTEAVWRRIRVIPFTIQIPEAERDKHLKERLRAEADAVLTWIIEGWRHYRQRGGLDEPDAVMVATGEYKADSDAVGRFVEDECYTGGAQSAATTQALYRRWETWASQDGCLPLSRIAFGRALSAKGYPTDDKSHDRVRRGICLKTQVGDES
jgi:putative DNA primase/helicase